MAVAVGAESLLLGARNLLHNPPERRPADRHKDRRRVACLPVARLLEPADTPCLEADHKRGAAWAFRDTVHSLPGTRVVVHKVELALAVRPARAVEWAFLLWPGAYTLLGPAEASAYLPPGLL